MSTGASARRTTIINCTNATMQT